MLTAGAPEVLEPEDEVAFPVAGNRPILTLDAG